MRGPGALEGKHLNQISRLSQTNQIKRVTFQLCMKQEQVEANVLMLGHNTFGSTHRCNHKDASEGYCCVAVGRWEARASTWFNDTLTGERGNYTNATAGYVDNNLSSGIESNSRYMRRNVVGCAGTTQRISLEVFTPSLLQYLSIRSKKRADKILCPKTGAHIFPSEATYIPSKLWKKIQDFKVHRLLLSYCEASQHVRNIWAEDMELFHGCGKGESFGEAITRFRASGLKLKLARSATVGILIPTKSMMRHRILRNSLP
jgi:hypothetical protein